MRKLTKEQKEDIARIAAKKDEDLDFSDIPLKLDWSKAEVGKVLSSSEEGGDHAPGR